LDGGSLTIGFFLLSKRGLAKQSNNNEEIIEGYHDFGRLMVLLGDGARKEAAGV
jgi:hypothetical protein